MLRPVFGEGQTGADCRNAIIAAPIKGTLQ
jgi:hypothetical protein